MFEAQSTHAWPAHLDEPFCWPSSSGRPTITTSNRRPATSAPRKLRAAAHPVERRQRHIEVVNYSAGAAPGLTARVQLINSDGAVKWEKSARSR